MTKCVIYCLFTCLLLSVGCRKSEVDALLPGLIHAEAIIWDEPERALALLDTITVPTDDNYQYATWCLLYTQAQNLNDIKYTSDSLVQVAIRYFELQDDIHRKAMTWFYAGRVYADLRRTVEAADFYIKARSTALKTTDYRLQYLISLNYGWLCLNQMALDQAKELLDEACMHAEKSGIGKYRVIALDYIGRYHAFNQQMDSAALLLEQSVKLARQIGDSGSLKMTLNDVAIAYYRIEKYDRAISYLYESISIGHSINKMNLYPEYSNLGDIYRLIGKNDSAVYYLNKALDTNDIYLLRSCYFSLADINRLTKNWESAVHYTDFFWQYTDSIVQISHHKEITESHAQSEYQRLENTNSHLVIEKSNVLKGGLTLFVCILGSILILAYIFQRKLLRAEHFKQAVQNKLKRQLRIYHANEQEINKNNETIHSITEQLARRPELEKQQDMQDSLLTLTRDHNELLQQQNQQLSGEIDNYLQTLQEKKTTWVARDLIVQQNQMLQKNVLQIEKSLLLQMQLTGQLKRTPKYLTNEMKRTLTKEMDIVYPGFIDRLSKQHTQLSEIELLTCALIKLQFTSSEIGIITNVGAESVTRRKYRIKEKMQINQPDLWKKNSSLDIYLWFF